MKKSKKIICVLCVIVCLAVFVLPIASFASSAYTPSIPSNPVVPYLYGQYEGSLGINARLCGGLAPSFVGLYNNSNTWYYYNQYLSHDTHDSFVTNPYAIAGTEGVWVEQTDSVVYYGATTRHGLADNYLYFGLYGSLNPHELNLSTFVCETDPVYNFIIQPDYAVSELDYHSINIAITYFDKNDLTATQHVVTNYSEENLAKGFGYIETCGFYGSGEMHNLRDVMELYGVDMKGKHIVVNTVQIMFNVSEDYWDYDVVKHTYQPFMFFAIKGANDYINNNEFLNGLYGIGYDPGFSEGSNIRNFGVFSFISSSITGLLNFELFDGFYLWTMLCIAISIPLFIWILKMFAGG